MNFRKFYEYAIKGLSPAYYFRNFFLIVFFPALILYAEFRALPVDVLKVGFAVLSWLLYPYARFVYESMVGFVMGDNVFFVNGLFMLITKFITMGLCYFFAVFIAPFGMLYLLYYFSKLEKNVEDEKN